jgi:hypothetical protein
MRTKVSEESVASIIRVKRLRELETFAVINSEEIRRVLQLLVTVNNVPNSPILVTLMMEAILSSGALTFTKATRRNIPEDNIFHSHRREHLKSYIALTGCVL